MSMPPAGQHIRLRSLSLSLLICFGALLGCLQDAKAPSVERGVALLIGLLKDTHPDIRRTSVESLGKIGDQSAAPAVLALLTDPVSAVRAAAAQALGRLASQEDKAAIDGLGGALRDPEDSVRQAAALAIGEIEPSPRQLSTVAELLRASDVNLRRAAVRALLSLNTGEVVDWFLPLLNDPDTEVRQGAVAAIGLSGDGRAVRALGQRLMHDPSAAVRAEAAYHLGESNGQDLATLLSTAVKRETDPDVRRWIEAELKELRETD